jgi:hypothetical protein
MKHLNKKIFYLIIILLALLIPIFLFINWQSPEIPKIADDSKDVQETPQEIPALSNRDIAIKEVLENPDKIVRRTEINGETYFLTGYDDVFYGDNSKKENKPGQKFGGLIVFKLENGKPVFFWESNEYINVGRVGGFVDINNDGISEIVWEYDLGVTGRNNCFYIYKFVNDRFGLITPAKTIELITPSGGTLKYNRTLLCGDSALTYMKDIDNDGIPEIMVGEFTNAIIGDDIGGRAKDIRIYKYDGDKYYLWKEEKIGEEKP